MVNLHRANADVLEQNRPLARLFQRRRIWIFPPHRQDRCVRDGQAAQQLVLDGPIDKMRHETRYHCSPRRLDCFPVVAFRVVTFRVVTFRVVALDALDMKLDTFHQSKELVEKSSFDMAMMKLLIACLVMLI